VGRAGILPVLLVAAIASAVVYRFRSNPTNGDALVGVLEDISSRGDGQPDARRIRILFRKTVDGWRAFPSNCPDQGCLQRIASAFPGRVRWTVAQNGRNVGTVEAQTPKSFDHYSEVGLQAIMPGQPVPAVGERSFDYARFDLDIAYEPLVTVSPDNVRDPDAWTGRSLSHDLASGLRREFRVKFPDVTNCIGPNDAVQRWQYSDEDIRIRDVYVSARRWTTATVFLEDRCDGGRPDPPFRNQLITVDPSGRMTFAGEELAFVDAGDYEADGQSEVLCIINGYNHGGYALFYDDFKRRAVFEFSYH